MSSAATADIFAIGIGEAGSNLLASYLAQRSQGTMIPRLKGYLLMNTDKADIAKVREKYKIPKDNTLVYGETEFGVGGKFVEGYKAVMQSKNTILSQLRDLGYEGVSGFIIFTSLGGGTGCGGTPALIKILRERFIKEEQRRIYIYVVGVLPFKGQSSEALNAVWALSRLVKAHIEEEGADLILLLSNRTMLDRLLQFKKGVVTDIITSKLGWDLSKITEIEVPSTIDGATEYAKMVEESFIDLINPLAVKVVEYMLRPAVYEPGKEVFPTTDLADYARKLDPIVVPALYEDAAFMPDAGDVAEQIRFIIKHTVEELSLVRVSRNPQATSAFYILFGPKNVAKIDYDPYIKRALSDYLAPGASVIPAIVQYQNATSLNLLVLLGLPKLDE
ncbi:MAG: hypothetical protein ACP6IS_03600 [Candidatus Asgardarchaeia archaeon]